MRKTMVKLLAGMLLASIGSAVATVHYVDVNSTNATPPYANWTTAATNIQDAVDAAVAGDEVVVTNGTYATGGRIDPNGDDTRVVVDKLLSLRSVSGPQSTTIAGPSRCVYLTNSATLSGFTLTNGISFDNGGGVWCAASNSVVSNCVISGNQVWAYDEDSCGGGAYGGTLNNCTLTGNSVGYRTDSYLADTTTCGGGAAYSVLNHCTVSGNIVGVGVFLGESTEAQGGGAAWCTLNSCTVRGNTATVGGFNGSTAQAEGGGAAWCTLNNCTLAANSASIFLGVHQADAFGVSGGGAYYCTLTNCTVAGNWVAGNGGGASGSISGGGTYGCPLFNCIRFGNLVPGSCEDCWLGDPLFLDTNSWADLRLQSNSPCINAGINAFAPAGPDLDGNPRIVGGMVDIGAYEYQSLSLINFGVVSNQVGFRITGQSNQIVTVETSTDLVSWSPLATNTLNGHPFPFSDPTPATLPQRFYRAQAQ
jgi:hypothetical protein